ncbi:MAG: carboxypeptidase M32 [Patescibacteria group bacterium]
MKVTKITPIKELKKRLLEISHLASINGLLGWDQETNLPPKASDYRAASISELSAIIHSKLLGLDTDGLLSKLKKETDGGNIKGKDAVIVNETWRQYDRERKLPEAFVREMAEIGSKAQITWAQARKNNDFKLFLPWLTKIVNLKRKEAVYVGYKESPYDALIDQYEAGMTTAEASKILNDLKLFLVPFLKRIKESGQKIPTKAFNGKFPIDKQIDFNKKLLEKIGFDFQAGRIDVSTHPFATGLHPHDVRITSRYSTTDIFYSISSTIHEAGHALYEQGLPVEHFGTPLAESVSLGIHESQSRLWENMVGKSLPFWKHFYPLLKKEFPQPFSKIAIEDFYKTLNNVRPSFIRTESDEVTYNLHIILRFEIEKGMMEGTIDLKDLPKIWNLKMKEYFGIEPATDSQGVLQDVHWSFGGIGYFPTYTFGNLYSAQFYHAMEKDIPDISKKIEKGQFTEVREWLRKNIHATGKTHTAKNLAKKVTGEELNSKYFTEYLEEKYTEIYKL